MKLTNQELVRYSRHLNLPNFGIETQQKLKDSKVLVVGTGGLGAPLLQYLTAAGVGTIGVVDFDTVDETNLQRQVLFDTNDINQPKTAVAIRKLSAQNPGINFIEHNVRLDSSNALEIIKGYDVVADGTDNFQTRYLVNDACVLLDKVNVYASIFQFEGQVSVFNYTFPNGEKGPNYRDLFPTPPPPGMVPSCAEGGVLGVLPGIVGSLQASETIKVLTGMGEPLAGKLFLFDALGFSTRTMNVRKEASNPISGDKPTITGLIDYDEFC
ncbi:MAG: molybdopterin-synthase adenylyltransferase MoeB, partial [Bacteroidota bacterium]